MLQSGCCPCRDPSTRVRWLWALVAVVVASFVANVMLVVNTSHFASLCGGILAVVLFASVTWIMSACLTCAALRRAFTALDESKRNRSAQSHTAARLPARHPDTAHLLRGPSDPEPHAKVSSAGHAEALLPPGTRADPGGKGKWSRVLCLLSGTGWVVAVIGLTVLWASLLAYWILDASTQPSLTSRLVFSELDDTVTVVREASGMVHIEATTLHDAHFAQGVVHAQLRLWQMEFQRRLGNASLAEIAGEAALGIDKTMATYGFYARAAAAFTDLSPAGQAAIEAYIAGINAYLEDDPELPFEFHILDFKPAPWQPADALVWAKIMSLDLSGNLASEMARYQLHTIQNLTMHRIEQLMPAYETSRFPTVLTPEDIQGGGVGEPEDSTVDNARADMIEEWLQDAKLRFASPTAQTNREQPARRLSNKHDDNRCSGLQLVKASLGKFAPRGLSGEWFSPKSDRPWHVGASNNWVIGGNLTKSGKPLLCNDPHLLLTAPSIWFLNHLAAGNESVIGASFPGLPGVVIGRNKHIAWGVTNTGADVQDLYMMRGNATHYEYNGGMRRYEVTVVELKIKGQQPVMLPVRRSVYGPVINDNGLNSGSGSVPLCLCWTSLLPSVADTTMDAFLSINRARTWSEFRVALSRYVAPSQNFVFAHTSGDIGYQMPGRIPVRRPAHTGAYPVPGNGSFDWTGFVPFDSLPRSHNPTPGFIASANNRATPVRNYKYLITEDWDAGSCGYRAQRITDMINQTGPHDINTMKSIQLDYKSYLARDFAAVAKLIPPNKLSAGGRTIQTAIAAWDYNTTVGSATTTLFEHWWVRLTTLAAPETGVKNWDNPAFILKALQSDATGTPDEACTRHHRFDNCLDFAAHAMNAVAESVLPADGVDAVPKWGQDVHQAEFKSQLLGKSALGCFVNRKTPHGGDQSTVNVGHFHFQGSLIMDAGPSYRQIIDLAAPESSLFLNPLGQDGNEFSENYDNLLLAWSNGDYLPMVTENYESGSTDSQVFVSDSAEL